MVEGSQRQGEAELSNLEQRLVQLYDLGFEDLGRGLTGQR